MSTPSRRRSLIGNVDWNSQHHMERSVARHVVPLLGTWIEIFAWLPLQCWHARRSLIGNVDWNACMKVLSESIGSRSLIGNVDWNLCIRLVAEWRIKSFPYWERGLKSLNIVDTTLDTAGRSLIGNVDWNLLKIAHDCNHQVVPLLGTWIEMGQACQAMEQYHGRSLIGNVDWNVAMRNCLCSPRSRSLIG